MNRKRIGLRASTGKDGLKIKPLYEDSTEVVVPQLIICFLFLVAFGVSGYFFLQQPFTDRLEYLVGPFTLSVASYTAISGKARIFTPAFVLGCIWGGASLFSTSISFNLPTYVFCWCCAVLLMLLLDVMKG